LNCEREILISILKLTKEGPVHIELLAKDSKVPLSVVKGYVAKNAGLGLIDKRDKIVRVTSIQRLKIALRAVSLGADFERVCRNLSWKEFEEIAMKTLQINGYSTIKHFRFRHKNRVWVIDLLAAKGRTVVCVDCKRWRKRLTASTAEKVVEAQVERVTALSEAFAKVKGKINFTLENSVFLVPVILSLVSSPLKFCRGVPIVPILQLQNFLNELPAQVHSLTFVKPIK
jgi:Holliday junction resolvase-like predicted endonuclease